MKGIRTLLLSGVLVFAITAFGQDTKSAADRGVPAKATSGGAPGTMFRDCPDCPKMVVIPAGNFIMGSSASEKSWAATHGASAESVSDESPQHPVSLRSFALGKYDVTRGEYAAFIRETGYAAGDGCYDTSFPKSVKRADGSWQNPGFRQTDRDPVTCVSWEDAQAYVSWLNGKLAQPGSTSANGPYPAAHRIGMGICGAGWDEHVVLVG